MATIPQIRSRLLEGFPEKQADLIAHAVIEAHDDLVTRADFHELTGVVKELAEAQKRTESRVEELAEAQKHTETCLGELAVAQKHTEGTVADVVQTQNKILIRLDRLDGHMLEDKVSRNLPAFLGMEFRRCRVLERAEFVEGLEGRLAADEMADLMRADTIATARRGDETVHIVVETSCTADSDDIKRAVRRRAALQRAGFTAIGIVACEMVSPQTLDVARAEGLRVLAGGCLLPEAA
mgnify:CR=1 FL=1